MGDSEITVHAPYERVSRPKIVHQWGGKAKAFDYLMDHSDYLLYMKGKAKNYYVTNTGFIARKSDGRPLALILLKGPESKGGGWMVKYLDRYKRNLRRSNLFLIQKGD